MLKIIKPKKQPAGIVEFDNPLKLQDLGIEMLITLNMSSKKTLCGPEIGDETQILVIKESPHYLYNPVVSSKDLLSTEEHAILSIEYQDHNGNHKFLDIENNQKEILMVLDYLQTGKMKEK